MPEPSRDEVRALRARLDALTIRDATRLRRRLKNLRNVSAQTVAALTEQVAAAEASIAGRIAAVPAIGYPDLPISDRRADIGRAIADHQVVVVAGETGSGKTTQLPKICLEAGRGIRGMIGHTQPRRLAARTVAQRIADELATPLGETVGYAVRFTDRAGERTLVKLMTDGILLAEIQRDRRLLRYDTLILDEAHERSLNIDFLLGYLRDLLPRRPDLKLIVTSATIEPQRFAAHFSGAPIIEVSGRTYPVDVRYRPLELVAPSRDGSLDPDDPDHDLVAGRPRDQTEAIIDAVAELQAEPPGDVLVFLSGEREIRDTAEALRAALDSRTEVLPLYARLPTAEQHKVFAAHSGRRVVLATNVAETSLTVPGIRYVVDPGTARISRYSRRTKVQRLPIEPISQASAAQRAGRSGRTAPGVCIRLYSEQDFDSRPRYTDPEILRTNLASVILQMAALGLGEVQEFGFLDPPEARSVRDGVALLVELGAFDSGGVITDIGRRLAQLPVDPRLGRMILAADTEGCVYEILVLAAALSIPDPRERPLDREQAARASHARFADEHSDFVSYLNLWRYLGEQRNRLSSNAFRRLCRAEFLHHLRIREWQDLVGQLRGIAAGLGVTEGRPGTEPADPARVHAALSAGLLSHVGVREAESREYLGARNAKFVLAPGSVLAKHPPRWVMVADLVETGRLYGRIGARIDPEAIERIAAGLVSRSYSEPHWDATRGAVMAYERVTLYGMVLVARRRVGYSAVDPALCRELFIRHALVEGDWSTRHRFFADNARLRSQIGEIEDRERRRDLLVDDDLIYALYDARIPDTVVSARHFDAWWKRQRRHTADLLTFTRAELLRAETDDDHPETWCAGDLELPLSYRFEPGAADDGLTVRIPVQVLARLKGDGFAWQVPALREEIVTALIRSLPKELRRNFVPAPDAARAVVAGLGAIDGSVLTAVQRALRELSGILVPIEAFDVTKMPPHLRMTFAVDGADGAELARGKDLEALQAQLAGQAGRAVAEAVAAGIERDGLLGWPDDLAELPRVIDRTSGGHTVRGFPAFVEEAEGVAVRVFSTCAGQEAAMRAGVRRLLRVSVASPVKGIERQLKPPDRLMLGSNPDGSLAALLEDCADAATDALVSAPVWTREDFEALRERVATRLTATVGDVVTRVQQVLTAAHEVQIALAGFTASGYADAVADIGDQLGALLPRGFVTASGSARLSDLTRYLRAISRRLDRLPRDRAGDTDRMARVHAVSDAYRELIATLSPERASSADVTEIGWQIQELRVSLWAQQLGTPRPVSEARIYRAIEAIQP